MELKVFGVWGWGVESSTTPVLGSGHNASRLGVGLLHVLYCCRFRIAGAAAAHIGCADVTLLRQFAAFLRAGEGAKRKDP